VRSMSNKSSGVQDTTANHETQWSEADYERHFTDHGKSTHADGRLVLSRPCFGAFSRIKTWVCSVLKSNWFKPFCTPRVTGL
jgi:hypothetical protein